MGVTGEFDNNVFLLSASRRADLDGAAGADPSDRYKNMDRASDVIVETEAGLRLRSPGLAGRDFAVAPQIRYEHYLANSERSNFTAALGMTQDFPRASRLRARAAYTPEFFARNYLSDATDANRDGTIAPSERRYSSGKYSEFGADVAYRFRIRKAPRTGTTMSAEGALGYYSRSFQAPFSNRDLSGPVAALEIGFDRGHSALSLHYDLQALSLPAGSEVLLLDEREYRRDFNGNGRSTDINARTVQQVDRSRNEHSGTVSLKLGSGAKDANIAFDHRVRVFSSTQPFDAAHLGRRDRRNEVRGEVGLKMASGFRVHAGGRIAKQTTNRPGDPGALGDIDDFVRARAFVGIRKSF